MTEQVRRASRLLQVESLLRARPGGMSTAELARELGYSARTVQRDIAVLESELGVPLILSGRRYQIMPGSHPLAPVRLTLQEARAIFLATRLFARHADERDPDGISALEKLADALPVTVRHHVQATIVQLKARPQDRVKSEVLRNLTEAWAASRTINITYRSNQRRATHSTALDPYLLEPSATGAATYVIGYSHDHEAVRTFKVDRILRAEPTGAVFEARQTAEIMERVGLSWGVVFGDDQYDVTVDFSAAVADRVRETNWHPSQRLTAVDGGGVRLELSLPSLLEFVPWVRGWGAEALVIGPAELRDEVARSLRDAAARYGAT
ncbi:MAG: helix-turn-helix transcriptional regulator [Tepidiformaceae bacterium]